MPLVYKDSDSLGEKSYEVVQGSYTQFQTMRQTIELFTHATWGRMVFIDNELQSTTKDEAIYHAALVKDCSTKGTVCILGGGEGATARDVLKRSSGDVVMVDWDLEFVTYMCKEETAWAQGAFSSPRLIVCIDDVFSWVHGHAKDSQEKFTTVLIDLCDPPMFEEGSMEEDEEWCRWVQFFQGVKGGLVAHEEMEEGVACVTMNVGRILPWDDQAFLCFTRRMRVVFPPSEYRIERSTAFVPSFGADWGFLSVFPRGPATKGDL
jgi:spermidine synthase